MEKRIILFLVLSMALIVLYPYLMEKLGVSKRPSPAPQQKGVADRTILKPPPLIPEAAPREPLPESALKAMPLASAEARHEQEVTVETDLFKVVLSNKGGIIKSWELKRYRTQDIKDPRPIQLVPIDVKAATPTPPLAVQVTDSHLQQRIDHAVFAVSQNTLNLTPAQPAGRIDFTYTDLETGVRIEKRMTFTNGVYIVDLEMQTTGITGPTTLWLGTNFGINKWEESFVGFIGPATLINGNLSKDTPDKEAVRTGQVTWVSLQDKYFLAAAIPADAVSHEAIIHKEGDKLVAVGLRSSPGAQVTSRYRLFVGPKEYDTLKKLDLRLEDTIDFGWFIYGSWSIVRAVAKPLFYAIRYLYQLTHNYGVAIILITVGIKLLLAPLAYKSYKSMKSMAAVQPELQALQKKYADDRERLNKELMKLYKERRVNPVGGCLPMFFQIPVFVALFNILYMTIELRQAPFVFWIKDLSVQDPYYVLPIIMGVTMFVQQKIQPSTMDPKQAQIMLILPVFLTFLFITFPAGLVLYWLTNNVLTILQQVITDRYLLPKAAVPAPT